METRDAPKKLRKVRRLDCIRLDADDRTYFTEEGYLVDHPILTSCGIFEYANPDGSIRRELRLPKYVFDEKSLRTYKGKPIIITHEAGAVNKDNVDREQIGTILSEGYRDGEDARAEIIIHNTTWTFWKNREYGRENRMTQSRPILSSTIWHLLRPQERGSRPD